MIFGSSSNVATSNNSEGKKNRLIEIHLECRTSCNSQKWALYSSPQHKLTTTRNAQKRKRNSFHVTFSSNQQYCLKSRPKALNFVRKTPDHLVKPHFCYPARALKNQNQVDLSIYTVKSYEKWLDICQSTYQLYTLVMHQIASTFERKIPRSQPTIQGVPKS